MNRSWRGGLLSIGVALSVAVATPVRAQTTNTGADIVPGDCLAFTTTLKIKSQMNEFVNSPAFQKRMMPLVKKAYAKAKAEAPPEAQQHFAQFESPQVQHVLQTAYDLVGNEWFMYVDHDWMDFFQKLSTLPERMQGTLMMAAIGGGAQKPEKIFIPAIIDFLIDSKLTMPPLVMGFKPTDVAEFAKHMEALPQVTANAPVKFEKTDVGGTAYYTMKLQGKLLPIPEDKLVDELAEVGVSEQRAKDFYAWIGEQTLHVSLGASGKYVILSIAADNNHLKKLGQGSPLSANSALAPVREHLGKPNLLGLHYSSKELAMLGYQTPEQQKADIDKAMMPAQMFLPPGLGQKLSADIKEMIDYAAKGAPLPSETVAVDLDNKGMESYSYSKSVSPGTDYDRPIKMLQHFGGTPFLGVAGSSKSGKEDYQHTRTFFKKVYGYVNEYGLPKMEREQREKFKKYEAIVLPIVAEIDEITANKLIPAVDACQAGFVIDFKSKAQKFPEGDLPQPMPIPELGFGMIINDGDMLRDAVVGYVKAVQNGYRNLRPLMLEDGLNDPPPSLDFPLPSSTSAGGATQYFYPMPADLDPAILPHVTLSKNFVSFGSSPALSQRMLQPAGATKNEVVGIDQPSSSAAVFHMPVLAAAAGEWIEFVKKLPNGPFAKAPEDGKEFLDLALGGTLDIWNSIKSSTTRTFKQGEYEVTHTWTHMDLSGK